MATKTTNKVSSLSGVNYAFGDVKSGSVSTGKYSSTGQKTFTGGGSSRVSYTPITGKVGGGIIGYEPTTRIDIVGKGLDDTSTKVVTDIPSGKVLSVVKGYSPDTKASDVAYAPRGITSYQKQNEAKAKIEQEKTIASANYLKNASRSKQVSEQARDLFGNLQSSRITEKTLTPKDQQDLKKYYLNLNRLKKESSSENYLKNAPGSKQVSAQARDLFGNLQSSRITEKTLTPKDQHDLEKKYLSLKNKKTKTSTLLVANGVIAIIPQLYKLGKDEAKKEINKLLNIEKIKQQIKIIKGNAQRGKYGEGIQQTIGQRSTVNAKGQIITSSNLGKAGIIAEQLYLGKALEVPFAIGLNKLRVFNPKLSKIVGTGMTIALANGIYAKVKKSYKNPSELIVQLSPEAGFFLGKSPGTVLLKLKPTKSEINLQKKYFGKIYEKKAPSTKYLKKIFKKIPDKETKINLLTSIAKTTGKEPYNVKQLAGIERIINIQGGIIKTETKSLTKQGIIWSKKLPKISKEVILSTKEFRSLIKPGEVAKFKSESGYYKLNIKNGKIANIEPISKKTTNTIGFKQLREKSGKVGQLDLLLKSQTKFKLSGKKDDGSIKSAILSGKIYRGKGKIKEINKGLKLILPKKSIPKEKSIVSEFKQYAYERRNLEKDLADNMFMLQTSKKTNEISLYNAKINTINEKINKLTENQKKLLPKILEKYNIIYNNGKFSLKTKKLEPQTQESFNNEVKELSNRITEHLKSSKEKTINEKVEQENIANKQSNILIKKTEKLTKNKLKTEKKLPTIKAKSAIYEESVIKRPVFIPGTDINSEVYKPIDINDLKNSEKINIDGKQIQFISSGITTKPQLDFKLKLDEQNKLVVEPVIISSEEFKQENKGKVGDITIEMIDNAQEQISQQVEKLDTKQKKEIIEKIKENISKGLPPYAGLPPYLFFSSSQPIIPLKRKKKRMSAIDWAFYTPTLEGAVYNIKASRTTGKFSGIEVRGVSPAGQIIKKPLITVAKNGKTIQGSPAKVQQYLRRIPKVSKYGIIRQNYNILKKYNLLRSR